MKAKTVTPELHSGGNVNTSQQQIIQHTVPLHTKLLNGETWFEIANDDAMPPFFMSVVSDSNHWMFIASNGGLTAGRKHADYALFPYYTDDKITESTHTTGPVTIIRVQGGDPHDTWQPFSVLSKARFRLTRNLYKNLYGNKIMFEEVNHDLGLTFRYTWSSSNLYGFVREASLINHSSQTRHIALLDGLQNILPYGVGSDLQNRQSNLVDAYKRSELIAETGIGIFALSAIIVDRAEPSEALKANVVWSQGLPDPTHLLSSVQLHTFRESGTASMEHDMKGVKGAYLICSSFSLPANDVKTWTTVANVNQNHADIARLSRSIKDDKNLLNKVMDDVQLGSHNLSLLIASADGLQRSSDILVDARHRSNVLFNIMRGGVPDHNYQIEKNDFSNYLRRANNALFENSRGFLSALPEVFDVFALSKALHSSTDADLLRLCTEYLPLKFSRRHGDPSRPWNKFLIHTRSETDGSKVLNYEGNWRDIFQNWESLAHAYPAFVEAMIFKFLNASTFDGYNPYRVTKDGFDWEVVEHDDPWSFIGYWGDHQIIYLLKFLELQHDYFPEAFRALFAKAVFAYANVPYRIKPYADIVHNPKDTIVFDDKADRAIRTRIARQGADGALVSTPSGAIHHVNFTEKILATVLAKVSNFIPEAGIWLNTQRPEWNDANNALVGNGVSMVTLYYLHRFLKFFEPFLRQLGPHECEVSDELAACFTEINAALSAHTALLSGSISDNNRRKVADALGQAGARYRTQVYENGFSGSKTTLDKESLCQFAETTLQFLEHAIRANRRSDGLYHAYNLLGIAPQAMSVDRLPAMLEGQVAALSSGYLSAAEALDVLDAMRHSELYRPDQQSYMLYPNKELSGFMQKNRIPDEDIQRSQLLQKMLADGKHHLVNRDVDGHCHFNGNFRNAGHLQSALNDLRDSPYAALASNEASLILGIYEKVFNHKAFTGRSGTFFAYEGLGSIYWHMVSKLHYACYENALRAREAGDEATLQKLSVHFYEIGEGIGVHKSPEKYGAFPTDPYSHTPWHRGAQQPGMTGQVKEDILVRFGELGVQVRGGRLHFQPFLLKPGAFTKQSQSVELFGLDGNASNLHLSENALAFTVCQVPVIYRSGRQTGMEIQYTDGQTVRTDKTMLDEATSRSLFERRGEVKEVTVWIGKG
jgi:hypothetical protein